MSRRRGFTFIELLTVIALVAVLLAIGVPKVVQTQEQARANQCKNNLKQLGLAIHNYHDTYNSLPPGWVAAKPDADAGFFLGWQRSLLPYLDQAPLYNQIDSEDIAANEREVLGMAIPVLRCPSDSMVDKNPLRGKFGTSSYSGNAGNERLPGSVDTPEKLNGIFWRNSHVRFRDIKDGLSNTFLAGERGIDSGSGIWVGVTANRNENDAITDCSHHAQLNRSITSFSGRHPGVVMFVMLDGAIRPIAEDVESSADTENLGLFQKLAQRNDSQRVGDF